MAILTPTGIIADFELIFGAAALHPWRPERSIGSTGTIHAGTAHSGGVDCILPTGGEKLHIDGIAWGESGRSRPLIGDFDPADRSGRNYDDLATETVALSFYIWVGSTLYEYAVANHSSVSSEKNWMRWSSDNRPSSVVANAAARMLLANSGQATVVSNFVRGLGTPDAAFTSAVTNLAVQFTDTSAGGTPTSWLWNFGDSTTSTLQNPVHTYANAGIRTVTLTATNAVGSSTTTAQVTAIAPKLAPPSVTNLAGTPAQTSIALTWQQNGDGGDPLTSQVVRFQASGGSAVFQTVPTAATATTLTNLTADTEYSIQIRLFNNTGRSSSETIVVSTTAADLSPLLPEVADQTGIQNTAFSITLPAGTGGNPPLTYSVIGLPSWASFNAVSRVLSGTPNAARTTTVTYTVTDTDGDRAGRAFNIVVAADLSPSAPTVANQTGVVGTAFSVTLPVGTGGDPPLTYSVSGAPSWATFNTTSRVLSGTPDATGATTVTYTVTDTDGDTDNSTFNIVVPLPDTTPVLATVADQTGVVGTEFLLTLPAASDGNPPIAYTLTGAPAWASFAPSTRRLAGTPGVAGSHDLTYTARDTDGDTAVRNFRIAVTLPPPPPASGGRRIGHKAVWAEVFTAGGAPRGLVSPGNLTIVDTLDQVGQISLDAAATARARAQLQRGHRLRIYRAGRLLREGYITETSLTESPGVDVVSVAGLDSLIELQRISTLYRARYNNVDIAEVVSRLCALAGWSARVNDSGNIAREFNGISIFAALNELAELRGMHFRVVGDRKIEFGPLGAVAGTIPSLLLSSLSRLASIHEVANTIYPHSGSEEYRLTLRHSSHQSPYPVTRVVRGAGEPAYGITDRASVARYGVIEATPSPRSLIVPIAPGAGQIGLAGNALYDWATAWLRRHAQEDTHYSLALAGGYEETAGIMPGDRVRLVWAGNTGSDDGLVATLFVTNISRTFTENSEVISLNVSNIDERLLTDEIILRQEIQGNGRVAHNLGVASVTTSSPGGYSFNDGKEDFLRIAFDLPDNVSDVFSAVVIITRHDARAGPAAFGITVDGNKTPHDLLTNAHSGLTATADIVDYIAINPGRHFVEVAAAQLSGRADVNVNVAFAEYNG